jgi:TM2 domain-containing membrane protein YozV
MDKKTKSEMLYEMKKKRPGLAVLWSILFTGAGHWYMGKVGKGFAMLGLQVFLWIFLMGWIMWIVTPIVAYYDTKKVNKLLRLELDLE